jgi:hypothetical protein
VKFNISTADDRIRFKGEITANDLLRLNLDAFDRALLDDKAGTPADCLLVLEMLFRRAAEQGIT